MSEKGYRKYKSNYSFDNIELGTTNPSRQLRSIKVSPKTTRSSSNLQLMNTNINKNFTISNPNLQPINIKTNSRITTSTPNQKSIKTSSKYTVSSSKLKDTEESTPLVETNSEITDSNQELSPSLQSIDKSYQQITTLNPIKSSISSNLKIATSSYNLKSDKNNIKTEKNINLISDFDQKLKKIKTLSELSLFLKIDESELIEDNNRLNILKTIKRIIDKKFTFKGTDRFYELMKKINIDTVSLKNSEEKKYILKFLGDCVEIMENLYGNKKEKIDEMKNCFKTIELDNENISNIIKLTEKKLIERIKIEDKYEINFIIPTIVQSFNFCNAEIDCEKRIIFVKKLCEFFSLEEKEYDKLIKYEYEYIKKQYGIIGISTYIGIGEKIINSICQGNLIELDVNIKDKEQKKIQKSIQEDKKNLELLQNEIKIKTEKLEKLNNIAYELQEKVESKEKQQNLIEELRNNITNKKDNKEDIYYKIKNCTSDEQLYFININNKGYN